MHSVQHEQPSAGPSSPTILCVDDDLDVLCAIDLRMREYDVNLMAAFDGSEGFDEALRHKPDVILTDLEMRSGDGLSMLERFRRHSDTRNTPIIVLTGLSDPKWKRQSLYKGANQFLRKPIAFDKLICELGQFVIIRPRKVKTLTAMSEPGRSIGAQSFDFPWNFR